MVTIDMSKETTNPCLDALYYAWGELAHLPFDQGDCNVHLEHEEREIYNPDERNNEFPSILGTVGVWRGEAKIRREEGGTSVSVRVIQTWNLEMTSGGWVMHPGEIYGVDVDWLSTDCDGRYSGSHSVTFAPGTKPTITTEPTRDHSAEAAGY